MADIKYEPADIVIYIQGKGMVLKEKSLVAFNTIDGKIVAFGTEAEHLVERTAENVRVMSPLRQGMIADYYISVQLFTHLLHKAWGKKPICKPSIAVCVPECSTEVVKKAMEEAIFQIGARNIVVAPIPVEQFAAAIVETPEKLPRKCLKCKTMIGITKDDPERYVAEELSQLLQYAGQQGISAKRVAELLQRMSGESAK